VFLYCLDFLALISNQQLLQGRSRSMEGLMSSNNSGCRITVLNERQHYIKLYVVAWKTQGPVDNPQDGYSCSGSYREGKSKPSIVAKSAQS
jgi:hypothetical protein